MRNRLRTANATRRAPRTALGLGLMSTVFGLVALAWVPFFGGAAGAQSPSNISITQTPAVSVGPCIGQHGLTHATFSDSSTFRLRVVAPADPCQPIHAKAAIYAMPGKGAQWPQTLKEVVPFTISEAGVTTITFAKTCTPVQFDVVTGATPPTIIPLIGEFHGPLLFPADINTSFQDPGISCTATTTTALSGSTTVAPSTTAAVLETTAVNPTTTAAVVQGSSSDRGPGASGSNAPLAVTGSSSSSTAVVGVMLLAGGAILIGLSRRGLGPHAHMITSAPSVDPDSPFSVG